MKSLKPIRLLMVLWLGISMLLVEIRSPFAQEEDDNGALGRIEETESTTRNHPTDDSQERLDAENEGLDVEKERLNAERLDACHSGDPIIVARTILPDGGIDLRNSNGCTWRRSPEGDEPILLDPAGNQVDLVLVYQLSSVNPLALPSPPANSSEAEWLNKHSDELLRMIVSLVPNDENAEANYLKSEKSGATIYERIERRTATIDYMTQRQ